MITENDIYGTLMLAAVVCIMTNSGEFLTSLCSLWKAVLTTKNICRIICFTNGCFCGVEQNTAMNALMSII